MSLLNIMKKFEVIRALFDYVMANGEHYSHSDAISEGCTRDGMINRVYVKKVNINESLDGSEVRCDNITVTCTQEDMSDATDADVRITFIGAGFGAIRRVLYANELSVEDLTKIYKIINNG